MKRNFTNENFEHFLRQSADGLRMRPDERVWKGISNNIDNRKRRIALIFGALLLIGTGISFPLINTEHKAVKSGPATITSHSDQHLAVLPKKTTSKLAVVHLNDQPAYAVKRDVRSIDHFLNTLGNYAGTQANHTSGRLNSQACGTSAGRRD